MACPCGSGLQARVYLDSVEITDSCVAGEWTPRLNRPAQASVTVPMDSGVVGDCGSVLKIVLTDGVDECIVFHGHVLNIETDTDKDGGRSVFNASDPMELWGFRPVRADDGDLSKPIGSGLGDGTDLIATHLSGPQILQAMLQNSEGDTTAQGNPLCHAPTFAEGPTFLTFGSFAGGGEPLYGAPTDWPQDMLSFFSTLVSTGQLDAIITYTDPGGGILGTVDAYNGDYGADLSGSVRFSYGMGGYTAASVRWNRDMSGLVNKYQIFAGPRVETAADLAGEQHWCYNVTGQDGGSIAGFPGPPDGLRYPPGGQSVDAANSPNFPTHGATSGWSNNELGEKIYNSRQNFGVRMKIDVVDGFDENCVPGFPHTGRMLTRWQWVIYSWFAAEPRELFHITPVDDTLIGCFGIGDIVGVDVVSDVLGGLSAKQRVYEYTVSWEATPSVLTLSELQTSSDAEM